MSTLWHVAVVIPACNEEMLLSRCLRSVQRAQLRLPEGITSDVIVVADNCSDETEAIAREVLNGHGLVVSSPFGNVGCARRIGVDAAMKRSAVPMSSCWIANTDADCAVPHDWLRTHVQFAMAGLRAVAGIIEVDTFAEHLPHVKAAFEGSYQLESDGTHPHVHGANLGFRADSYLLAGGWGTLATAEDHDLWSRLRSVQADCRQDVALKVVTSGRKAGRAPAGFAAALAAHNHLVVENAE